MELVIASLGLGYDEERESPILVVQGIEGEDEDASTLVCWGSRGKFRKLQKDIARLLATGRPRCPLCEAALEAEAPHFCVRMN